MMNCLSGCLNGKTLIAENKDICKGSYLIQISDNQSDREQRRIGANNEFACERCKSHLTNEEQLVCDLD